MRLLIAILAGASAGLGAQAAMAADAAQIQRGEHTYQYSCAPCHQGGLWEGRQLPGAISLQLKYKGERPAALEDRTDLTPEFVAIFIRHGVGGMPAFRKTEISDAEMADIGAYLSRNTK
jgi:(+)-pinoresinol hydroxylase